MISSSMFSLNVSLTISFQILLKSEFGSILCVSRARKKEEEYCRVCTKWACLKENLPIK